MHNLIHNTSTQIAYFNYFNIRLLLLFLGLVFDGKASASENTNAKLLAKLRASGAIQSDIVHSTMTSVDRGQFYEGNPYMEFPQAIGHGATISAPYLHAHALELLRDNLKPGMRALDVGSGSGYLTACFAVMVGETGKVVGIDHVKDLVDLAEKNVRKGHADMMDSGQIKLIVGDGRLGYPDGGPYNAIHVGAAAKTIPQPLIDQLAPGGRLVLPVESEGGEQFLEQVEKGEDGKVNRRILMGVQYIPLTDEKIQCGV